MKIRAEHYKQHMIVKLSLKPLVNTLSESLNFSCTSIHSIGFQLKANGTILLLPFEWNEITDPSKELWQAS